MLGRIMQGWSDCQLTSIAVSPPETWTWGKYMDRDSLTRTERGCLVAQAVDFRSIPQPRWRFWRPSRGITLHRRLNTLPQASVAVRRFDALARWMVLRELKRLRREAGRTKGWSRVREQEVERAALSRIIPLLQQRAWRILAQRAQETLPSSIETPQVEQPLVEEEAPVLVSV